MLPFPHCAFSCCSGVVLVHLFGTLARRDEGGGTSSTWVITQAEGGTCQFTWAVAHQFLHGQLRRFFRGFWKEAMILVKKRSQLFEFCSDLLSDVFGTKICFFARKCWVWGQQQLEGGTALPLLENECSKAQKRLPKNVILLKYRQMY